MVNAENARPLLFFLWPDGGRVRTGGQVAGRVRHPIGPRQRTGREGAGRQSPRRRLAHPESLPQGALLRLPRCVLLLFLCFFVSLFCFLFVVVVVVVVLSPESVLFAFSDPGSSSFGTTTAQSVCSGANTVMEL